MYAVYGIIQLNSSKWVPSNSYSLINDSEKWTAITSSQGTEKAKKKTIYANKPSVAYGTWMMMMMMMVGDEIGFD